MHCSTASRPLYHSNTVLRYHSTSLLLFNSTTCLPYITITLPLNDSTTLPPIDHSTALHVVREAIYSGNQYTILYYAMLQYDMLRYATICHATLCYQVKASGAGTKLTLCVGSGSFALRAELRNSRVCLFAPHKRAEMFDPHEYYPH